MCTVQIFDKAMCCPTGVCGPEVDPVLPRFAADLEWLQRQGHEVHRWNLSQNPSRFARNEVVQKLLAEKGVECLPLVMVDDRIMSCGEYPSRDNLALWTNTPSNSSSLPIADQDGCCGGESGCC